MEHSEEVISTESKEKKPRKRMKAVYGQIKEQMEFYFSDSNLNRDRFMKKQMDQSEDGFIPLEMFLNFNKIKELTSETSVIATALKSSDLLKVNEDGTKVQRTRAVSCPKDIDNRTVYVECLPHNVDHEWIKKMFNTCGKVLYVSIPRYKSTGDSKGFAFIEFDSIESAKKACEEFNNPPAEASDKPGKFPRSSKQLVHLQKTLAQKEHVASESDKSLTESPTKSGKKKKRRRQASECSVEGSDVKQRKIDFDEKDHNQDLSKKEEEKVQPDKELSEKEVEKVTSTAPAEDSSEKDNKKKNKKRKRSKGDGQPLTESETSDQLSESDRESRKRKTSDNEGLQPPSKVQKEEKTKDDKENKDIDPNLKDNSDKTEKVNKKKKNRQHKTKHKDKEIPELRVISKKEWLGLRAEYIKLQKQSMNELKKTLNKIQKKTKEQNKKSESVEEDKKSQNVEDKNEEKKGKERPVIDFTPDCIVMITSGRPMYRREIKDDLENDFKIAYIDVKETSKSGYIRMKDADSAKRLSEVPSGSYFFTLLQGQEEKDYWSKLEADRNEKFNSKTHRKKQKGSQKLMEKAHRIAKENVCKTHIKFDND